MWVDYHFQLDFNDSYCPCVARLKQYDRFLGRFVIRPTINGAPIDLTKLQARLAARKRDGTQCLMDGTIGDGLLTFTLDDQMATVEGAVRCEVILSESVTDGMCRSATFTVQVVKGEFDENALESQDSYPALLNALDAAHEVRDTPQTIDMGGTGATTAEQALINLGAQPKQNDSGWKAISLAEGVAAKNTGGYDMPMCRKVDDHVIIQGGVSVTSGLSAVSVGFLPSGYGPATTVHKMVPCGGQRIARIHVTPQGEIVLEWMMNMADGTLAEVNQWLTLNIDYYK